MKHVSCLVERRYATQIT